MNMVEVPCAVGEVTPRSFPSSLRIDALRRLAHGGHDVETI